MFPEFLIRGGEKSFDFRQHINLLRYIFQGSKLHWFALRIPTVVSGLRSFLFSSAMSLAQLLRCNKPVITNVPTKDLQPFHQDSCCPPCIRMGPVNTPRGRVFQNFGTKTKGEIASHLFLLLPVTM